MNLILLRAQLRGLSAFRSLLDTPLLKDALQLLDAAARRDGEGALAAYDQMFYLLKAEGYSGLGTWPAPAAPTRNWRGPPSGMRRPFSSWPSWGRRTSASP